jgi:hypothetical protein
VVVENSKLKLEVDSKNEKKWSNEGEFEEDTEWLH